MSWCGEASSRGGVYVWHMCMCVRAHVYARVYARVRMWEWLVGEASVMDFTLTH